MPPVKLITSEQVTQAVKAALQDLDYVVAGNWDGHLSQTSMALIMGSAEQVSRLAKIAGLQKAIEEKKRTILRGNAWLEKAQAELEDLNGQAG